MFDNILKLLLLRKFEDVKRVLKKKTVVLSSKEWYLGTFNNVLSEIALRYRQARAYLGGFSTNS